MVSERVQAASVAVFVLLVMAVVAVLLTRVDREAPSEGTAAVDPGQELDAAGQEPVGSVSLNAGKGDLVMRFLAGSCTMPGGPKLELSLNQGRTFRLVHLPQIDDGSGVGASSPTVRAVVFAEASSRSTMVVDAADAECGLNRYKTVDGGATWQKKSGSGTSEWHRDPKSAAVVAPAGPTDVGCAEPVSLAAVTKKTAKVFCGDGSIRETTSAGATWADAGELQGVTAAVFTSATTGYASVQEAGCESRVFVTTNGGLTWEKRGCVLPDFDIPAMSGTDKWLIAGGTGGPKISTNQGLTWKAPKKP